MESGDRLLRRSFRVRRWAAHVQFSTGLHCSCLTASDCGSSSVLARMWHMSLLGFVSLCLQSTFQVAENRLSPGGQEFESSRSNRLYRPSLWSGLVVRLPFWNKKHCQALVDMGQRSGRSRRASGHQDCCRRISEPVVRQGRASPSVLHVFRFRFWYRRRGRQSIRWLMSLLVLLLVALAVGWALFIPVADWLATHDVGNVTGSLRASSLQTARDAARGRLLTFGAGLFAVGALVYTARNFSLSREGQVTDRYTKAIEQLGSDKLDVRIGGIYALERVAHDSGRDHPTVIEVLCAFIREHSYEEYAISQVRPDVQAALTVVGRRNSINDRQRTSLNGADLADADLLYADLTRVNFTGADLAGANLAGANLTEANLTDAKLTGANLKEANLTHADFTCVNLADADLTGREAHRYESH
jgi:hypothetical protein